MEITTRDDAHRDAAGDDGHGGRDGRGGEHKQDGAPSLALAWGGGAGDAARGAHDDVHGDRGGDLKYDDDHGGDRGDASHGDARGGHGGHGDDAVAQVRSRRDGGRDVHDAHGGRKERTPPASACRPWRSAS